MHPDSWILKIDHDYTEVELLRPSEEKRSPFFIFNDTDKTMLISISGGPCFNLPSKTTYRSCIPAHCGEIWAITGR